MLRLCVVVTLVIALAATAVAGDGLFLWKVTGEHATVHLTGSIHVGKADFFPLAEPLEQAFDAADVLAVEVDLTDPAVMQSSSQLIMSRGMLTGEETLQDRLEPATWEKLEAYCQETGVPLAMFQKMKPGIMAIVLMMNAYQSVGFDPELGIDKHFLTQARESGKEIRQLEKVEDQMELFFSVSDDLDDPLILEMLDQFDEIEAFTDRMIDLWRAGDAEGLDDFVQENIGDDPELQAFYRRLLDDRNVAMAEAIDGFLAGQQDVFVVVGAAHYGGEQGILKLLARKGREVEQVRP
jgi:uncharacterized protein YbaP (TraB family)